MALSATADGREEGDFIAGVKPGVPCGKFLVTRRHHGRAIFLELGNALGIESEELLDRAHLREVQGFFRLPHDIFQAAEEKDPHADGL